MTNHNPDKQTSKNGRGRKPGHTNKGRFAPGNPGGPGRPAGTPNAFSAEVRADLLEAYRERGGKAYLASLPDSLFVRLLATGMPRESAEKPVEPETPPVTVREDVLDLMRQMIGRVSDQVGKGGSYVSVSGVVPAGSACFAAPAGSVRLALPVGDVVDVEAVGQGQ